MEHRRVATVVGGAEDISDRRLTGKTSYNGFSKGDYSGVL